jgi:hypothetical protein
MYICTLISRLSKKPIKSLPNQSIRFNSRVSLPWQDQVVSPHAPRPDRLPAIPESPPEEKSKGKSINQLSRNKINQANHAKHWTGESDNRKKL